MFSHLSSIILAGMDLIVGWTLHFPHAAIIILLATVEALILTLIPKFTTNQDRLKRGKFDKLRLQQLIKEAKKKGDKDAIKRYRQTIGGITSMTLKAQGLPLLLSLIPVLFIAIWAFARLSYESPQAGQNLVIHAYFPTSQIGNLAHMVPQKGLEILTPKDPQKPNEDDANQYVANPPGQETWIQRITEDKDPLAAGKVIDGWATWVVKPDHPGTYNIEIRYKNQTADKTLVIGHLKYEPRVTTYDDGPIQSVEFAMPEYKPLGVIPGFPIPGLPFLAFPAWLVGYMIVVVPLALIFKPLLKVY